jgi:D-alanine transaminase
VFVFGSIDPQGILFMQQIAGIEGDPVVYLNGNWSVLSQAKVSVLDRGFIFGDGVYEVVPLYKGHPFRMQQHLARLNRSLAAIRIANPHTDEQWQALVLELAARNGGGDQFVYLQVTRGVAKRDHAFPVGVTPTVFAMSSPFIRPDTRQRDQGLAAVTVPDERWLHCEIKSVSLLGNVLARQYAVDHGVHEVVQFRGDYMTEGSASNIWVVSNGVLLAPPRNHLILEGIRYGLVEQLAQSKDIAFEIRPIHRDEVMAASELMLSSATKEILPIVTLDGSPVGAGVPGPVYRKLRAGYDEAIAAVESGAA